jgi:hypothetical protein
VSEPDLDLIEGVAGTEEEIPLGEGLMCPECGRRFKTSIGLGAHRRAAHDVLGRDATDREQPKKRRPRSTAGGSKGAEINRLRRELKKSVSALLLIPFMAKGTAERLTDPRLTALIDEKAEAFADSWVAVAEQNDYVRQNLTRLMSGGVWINAAAQTAALGYVVAVFSGLTPMHPGALMLLPEMGQFVYQQPPEEAAPTNGGGAPVGPESPGAQ